MAGACAAAVAELPPRGAAEEAGGPGARTLDLAQAALLRVRAACHERAIDLRPAFGEHDEYVLTKLYLLTVTLALSLPLTHHLIVLFPVTSIAQGILFY